MNQLDIKKILQSTVETINVPEVAYLSVLRIDDRSLVHIKMNPGAAAAIWEICKGIIVGLGAKALTKWFGLGDANSVERLLRRLFLDIADVVRASLDEAEIKKATSELQGLDMLMREYNNSPQTSKFRLDQCVTASALVIKRLENLLPLSADAYIFGVLFRLSAAQEIALLTESSGERQNVREFALASLPHLTDALKALNSKNEARVSEIIIENIPEMGPEPHPHPIRHIFAVYTVDGVSRSFDGGLFGDRVNEARAQAEASRQADLQRIRDDFMSRVGIPVAQSIQGIEQISRMA